MTRFQIALEVRVDLFLTLKIDRLRLVDGQEMFQKSWTIGKLRSP